MADAESNGRTREERKELKQQQREDLKRQIRAWLQATGGITLTLEVYVVLGKALLNQKVSVEGMWRLSGAIRHAFSRVSTAFPLIIFTGWAGEPPAERSEGRLLKSFFSIFECSSGFRWKGGILAEEEAPDTYGNIKRALELLHALIEELAKEFPNLRVVILRFILVSSAYHLQRMEEVDEYLSEVSDLHALRSEGRIVELLEVPYLYASCGNELCEWLAAGYRQLHRLVLLQVNLQGLGGNLYMPESRREKDIFPGHVGELRPVPFVRLDETIAVLTRLLARAPQDLARGEWLEKYGKAKEQIPLTLEVLGALREELAPYVGKPYDARQQEQWARWAKRHHEATGTLRTRIMDPDEPSHGQTL